MATQSEKETKEPLKIKKRAKNLGTKTVSKVTKIDLNAEKRQVEAEKAPTKVTIPSEKKEEIKKEVKEAAPIIEEVIEKPVEDKKEEVTVINEVVEETKKVEQELKEAIRDEKITGKEMPANIEKLVNFMEDTGGTVEDYVTLNKDYNKYDDKLLVKEYYKKTRPHLNDEEIGFVMQDNFTYDEEVDEERFVRKQKLAYKEEVAKAKNFLEQMKSKYYDEIKLRPSVTNEQKKAMDFFQRYNKEQSTIAQKRDEFVNNTKSFFQDKFEGFNFNVGDKKFRYKISNPSDVAVDQTDVSKLLGKFTSKDGSINDLDGYHKAMYAARNADRLAQHFYEQGKADATKDIVAKSKNISSEPRPMDTGETLPNGWKVRSISGVDSTKLKIKKRT
jgi:hypothetical protein